MGAEGPPAGHASTDARVPGSAGHASAEARTARRSRCARWKRRLLLVNPPIHDVAAYDFWARPLGLLVLAGALRRALGGTQPGGLPGRLSGPPPGALPGGELRLALLDCVDPGSPWLEPQERRASRIPDGRGKLPRSEVPRPARLPAVARRYSRYGLPPAAVRRALAAQPRPDLVLVGSMMTYWYGGVVEAIALIREHWPGVLVALGGVYASLCGEHAAASCGADRVIGGSAFAALGALAELLDLPSVDLPSGSGHPEPTPAAAPDLDLEQVLPAHDLSPRIDAAALLTSVGCPLACAYCAAGTLHPRYLALTPARVEREVRRLVAAGVRDLALYDDAFFAEPARAVEVLERIASLGSELEPGLRLHAASGLACRGLGPELARAMRRAGFATIRLGLATADAARARHGHDGKVSEAELGAALEHLEAAGFSRREVGVYVMVGLPSQRRVEVERALEVVLAAGARPHLAEYSPIPGSPLFAAARAASPLDLDEPLLHNPSLLPCAGPDLDHAALTEIKAALRARLAC